MRKQSTPVATSFLLLQLIFELLQEAMLFGRHLRRHCARPIHGLILPEYSSSQSQSTHRPHHRPDQRAYAPLHVSIHDVFPLTLCVFALCIALDKTISSTRRQPNNRQRRHACRAIFIH